MTTKTWQFKKDEIFTKTDKNGNTTMKIPPEVLKVNNWKEGDKVKVKIGDQGTIIIEKVDD
tara:strand:+ start:611 stop:793 length:183 start_codon:yes stop_codon:yes gene_type:complete